jgi:hypothetical protein
MKRIWILFLACFTVHFGMTQNLVPQPLPCAGEGGDPALFNLIPGDLSLAHYECYTVDNVTPPQVTITNNGRNLEMKAGHFINIKEGVTLTANNNGQFHALIEKEEVEVVWFTPENNVGEVPKHEKLELGLKMPASIESEIQTFITNGSGGINPFDPDQIDVKAILISPSQQVYTKFGFYYREFDPNNTTAWVEDLSNEYDWRLRYAPDELGTWKCHFEVITPSIGTYLTKGFTFNCVPSNSKGYVEIGQDQKHFRFSETGRTYFPISQNIAWPDFPGDKQGCELWKNYISQSSVGGANLFRLVMNTGFSMPLELGPNLNNYNSAQKYYWEIDRIFEMAEGNGQDPEFFLMPVWEFHGHFKQRGINNIDLEDWEGNAYNSINQSVIPNINEPYDFFVSTPAMLIFEKRLRYLYSRYGYSTKMMGAQLMSETDQCGGQDTDNSGNYLPWPSYMSSPVKSYCADQSFRDAVTIWHDIMGDYIKTMLDDKHLLSASFAECGTPDNITITTTAEFDPNGIYDLEWYDFIDRRGYVPSRNANFWKRFENVKDSYNAFGKPVLFCESGAMYGAAIDACTDLEYHNSLWGTAFNGGGGPAMYWWNWKDPTDIINHTPAFISFMADVDFESNTFTEQRYPHNSSFDAVNEGAYNTNDNPVIASIMMVSDDKEKAVGWAFNRTSYWGNVASIVSCADSLDPDLVLPDDDDFTSVVIPVSSLSPLEHLIEIRGLKSSSEYNIYWYNTYGPTSSLISSSNAYTSLLGRLAIGVPDLGNDWAFKVVKVGSSFMQTTITANSNEINPHQNQGMTPNEVAAKQIIGIHPNPTQGKFMVDFGMELEHGKVDVLDLMGKVVYSYSNINSSSITIDLNNQSKGIYLVKITVNGATKVEKVVYQ